MVTLTVRENGYQLPEGIKIFYVGGFINKPVPILLTF